MTGPEPQQQPQSSSAVTSVVATDHSVAAHTIGSVNYFEAAKQKSATAVLNILSMRSGDTPFLGRSGELEELAGFLAGGDQGKSIALVAGPPGVGKSALVRQATAGECSGCGRHFFHYALFADMRGYQPDSAVMPDEVYGSMLLNMGVAADDIPPDAGLRATMYHRLLDQFAAAGKAVLIWLDNVSSEEQFAALRPASAVHKTVVTTRESFSDVADSLHLEVGILDQQTSLELLETVARASNPSDERFEREHKKVVELAELCDRLPLALQIVAALLADEPTRPIAELVQELAAEEARLDHLDYDGGRLSVRAALRLSYQRLPDDLETLFRLLSVVPGGDVSQAAAAALMNLTEAAVRPRLMSLVRSHLIEQHVLNRWRMHDLVRLYSTELAAAAPQEADEAYGRVKDHYRQRLIAAFEWLSAVASAESQVVFSRPGAAAEWFESERLTLMSFVMQAIRNPARYDVATDFGVLLGDILKPQRHYRKEFHDISAAAASVAKEASDKKTAVCAMNNFGGALRKLEQYDRAIEVHREAEKMYKDMGDALGVSLARTNTANVLQAQGNFAEAIRIYEDDIRLSQRTGHRYNEASTPVSLGAACPRRRPSAGCGCSPAAGGQAAEGTW